MLTKILSFRFGFFPHHKSCDKYYSCENGTASLKICGNGLVFDDAGTKKMEFWKICFQNLNQIKTFVGDKLSDQTLFPFHTQIPQERTAPIHFQWTVATVLT